MGVNSATSRGGPGFGLHGVECLGEPEDYFYRLALDTLQIALKGHWLSHEGARHLVELRRQAELFKHIGIGKAAYKGPGERELTVFPHGGRPSYQVLLRDGDGLEIRALPSGDMPTFIFRFGARWCLENSIIELGAWACDFARAAGFEPEKVQLSQADIRCDTPTPFVEADLKKMRGTGTRNGRFNTHTYQRRLSGFDNLGGSKQVKFVVYDKRLEQTQKQGVLWPAVWKGYCIDCEVPIWRIELRMKRKALTAHGLDAISDLSAKAIRGLWYLFSHRYLTFVSASKKRTDRAPVTRKWARVQACGEMMHTRPIVAQVDVSATQLIKQATGCIARAMAVAGKGYAEAELREVIEQAVLVGEERFKEQRTDYVRRMLQNLLEKYPDEAFASAQAVRGEIGDLIDRSISRRLPAKPFSNNQ